MQPIVFCCFFSRMYRCRYNNRCRFVHSHVPPQTQVAINEGRAYLECERVNGKGFCKHKAAQEHI